MAGAEAHRGVDVGGGGDAALDELIDSIRYGTSSRLTTKPGVSMHSIGVLPRSVAKPIAFLKISADVCSVRTTSTSCISCTGLKKCKPTICAGLPQKAAILPIASDDVFDAMTQSGLRCGRGPRTAASSPMSSITASTTKSQLANAPRSSVGVMRPSAPATLASACSCVSLPFDTAFAASLRTLSSIRFIPPSRKRCSVSTATTSKPFSAAVCAMPWPIRPRPTTPTVPDAWRENCARPRRREVRAVRSIVDDVRSVWRLWEAAPGADSRATRNWKPS